MVLISPWTALQLIDQERHPSTEEGVEEFHQGRVVVAVECYRKQILFHQHLQSPQPLYEIQENIKYCIFCPSKSEEIWKDQERSPQQLCKKTMYRYIIMLRSIAITVLFAVFTASLAWNVPKQWDPSPSSTTSLLVNSTKEIDLLTSQAQNFFLERKARAMNFLCFWWQSERESGALRVGAYYRNRKREEKENKAQLTSS